MKETKLILHEVNQTLLVTCLADLNLARVSKHMPDDALALYFLLKLLLLATEKQVLVQISLL